MRVTPGRAPRRSNGADHQFRAEPLVAELAVLRDQVKQAHHVGSLDEGTYAAAEKELEVAAQSLPAVTPQSRGTFLVALKRLRGLIADVADLAAKVAGIIAAVQGLS